MYEAHPRRLLYSCGVPIPLGLCSRAYKTLAALEWPTTLQRQGGVTAAADDHLVLRVSAEAIDDARRRYPALLGLVQALMDWADPSFPYSAVAVTRNFEGSPHTSIDTHDRTFQYHHRLPPLPAQYY